MPTTFKLSKKRGIANVPNEKINCLICNNVFSYVGGVFRRHLLKNHQILIEDYYLRFIDENGNKCLCGCNQDTKWINTVGGRFIDYLHGHNHKNLTAETSEIIKKRSMKLKKMWNEGLKNSGYRNKEVQEKCARARSVTMKSLYEDGKLILPNMKISHEERSIAAQKAWKTIMINNHSHCGGFSRMKRGWYKSTTGKCDVELNYFQSSWEKIFMNFLDKNIDVKSWIRPKFYIEYNDTQTNKLRHYYPDFIVEYNDNMQKQLIELKGQLTQLDKDKFVAARRWVDENNMKFKVITYAKQQFVEVQL